VVRRNEVLILEVGIGHFARFRLFDDGLLSVLDEVDGCVDDRDGEELREALDGHESGPETRILVNRLNLAHFLQVLERDEDQAQEARHRHQNDNLDHRADTRGVLRSMFVIATVFVHRFDKLRAHHHIEDDQKCKVC